MEFSTLSGLLLAICWCSIIIVFTKKELVDTFETNIRFLIVFISGFGGIIGSLSLNFFILSYLINIKTFFSDYSQFFFGTSFFIISIFPIIAIIFFWIYFPSYYKKVFLLKRSKGEEIKDTLDIISRKLGISTNIKIFYSEYLNISPFVFGRTNRDVNLVLPKNFFIIFKDEEKREIVLSHELSHVKNKDLAFYFWSQMLLKTYKYWVPIYITWIIFRNIFTFITLSGLDLIYFLFLLFVIECFIFLWFSSKSLFRTREYLADALSSVYFPKKKILNFITTNIVYLAASPKYTIDHQISTKNLSNIKRILIFLEQKFSLIKTIVPKKWAMNHPYLKDRKRSIEENRYISEKSKIPSKNLAAWVGIGCALLFNVILLFSLGMSYFFQGRPDQSIMISGLYITVFFMSICFIYPSVKSYISTFSFKKKEIMNLISSYSLSFLFMITILCINLGGSLEFYQGQLKNLFLALFSIYMLILIIIVFFIFLIHPLIFEFRFLKISSNLVELLTYFVSILIFLGLFTLIYFDLSNKVSMDLGLVAKNPFDIFIVLALLFLISLIVSFSIHENLFGLNLGRDISEKILLLKYFHRKKFLELKNNLSLFLYNIFYSLSVIFLSLGIWIIISILFSGVFIKLYYLNELIALIIVIVLIFVCYINISRKGILVDSFKIYLSYVTPTLFTLDRKEKLKMSISDELMAQIQKKHEIFAFIENPILLLLGLSESFYFLDFKNTLSKIYKVIMKNESESGGFGFFEGGISRFSSTFISLNILKITNNIDSIDKEKHTNWLLSQFHSRRFFSTEIESKESIAMNFFSLKCLSLLNAIDRLENSDKEKIVRWTINNWNSSSKNMKETYYILEILNLLNSLDKVLDYIKTIWLRFNSKKITFQKIEKDLENVYLYVKILLIVYKSLENIPKELIGRIPENLEKIKIPEVLKV